MTKNKSLNDKSFAYSLIFFAAVLLKYLLYGFSYYPVLDDFIQYGGYPLYDNLSHVYFNIGTMASRPLASLLDPTLWGGMRSFMGLALFIISLLHFFAILFLAKTVKRCGFNLSPLFFIITLFIPIGFEGAYWISAASRLVVGLFFASLSLYFSARYFTDEKGRYLVLFAIFHLISYGFYEPVCIFAFVGVYLIVLNFRKKLKRVWWVLIIPVASLILLMLYYAWGASLGAMGSRASGFGFDGIFSKLIDGAVQTARCFTKGIYKSTVKGFFYGLLAAARVGFFGGLWLVLCAVVCLWLYKATAKTAPYKNKWLIFSGIILFLAPLAPNVVVETVWIPYRAIFVSIIGFALVTDSVFTALIRKKAVQAFLCSALLLVFLISGANEYSTYKKVSENDVILAQNIAEQLSEEVMRGEKKAVLITDAAYELPQVDLYKDHVKSVIEADWSLTGAVRAVTGNMNIKLITPARKDEVKITDEQVLYMGEDGHITDITEQER